MPELLDQHGGYRHLKTFQLSQLIYDITVRFCDRYIGKRSRTHDQMVQAARSGVQNIAEGSQASVTSKKTEIKLTQVARASLEELRLDYEDFLRQRRMPLWKRNHPIRQELIDQRCETADEVAHWVLKIAKRVTENGHGGLNGHGGQSKDNETMSTSSTMSTKSMNALYSQIAANAALVLIAVTNYLLDHQVKALALKFEKEGGFTERLYKVRSERRKKNRK